MNKDEIEENMIVASQPVDQNIDELLPSMNVNLANKPDDAEPALIGDEMLLGIYGEILDNLRADRSEIDEFLQSIADMVINGGDATSASKEALVQLVKTKTETADKMAKIADLMTRVKLKEKDTFPRYLAASQNNTINIGDSGQKRALLEAINKVKRDESES